MYLCKNYMASMLQRLVIPIFGYYNMSIPLLKHFIKDLPHKQKHYLDLINIALQPDVSYSAYMEVKFCSYNPSSNFNNYLWNGYFNNHFTTIMQGFYNSARLQTPCANYHNPVMALSQPYKVAARLLQVSYFRMRMVTPHQCPH